MKDNNILANAICEFVKRSKKKGLVEIPLPTGFGKTHAVMQAMSMMTDKDTGSFSDVERIIFTTTLKKNLPVEKLRKYYEGDFDNDVLLLKSNIDSLIDFHSTGGLSKIPEEFKDDTFHLMVKRLDRLKVLQAKKEKSSDDFEFIQELKERVNEDEQVFRKHIRSILRENFRTSVEQRRAIKKKSEFQWIGKLYPYIFIDEKKVIFMSAARKGYVGDEYRQAGICAYEGIIKHFIRLNNDKTISLTQCCAVAGLGPGLSKKVRGQACADVPDSSCTSWYPDGLAGTFLCPSW